MFASYSGRDSDGSGSSSSGEGSAVEWLDSVSAGRVSSSGMRRRRHGDNNEGDGNNNNNGNGNGNGSGNAAATPQSGGIDPAILIWSRYLGYDGSGNVPAGGIPRNSGGETEQDGLLSLRSDVLLAMRFPSIITQMHLDRHRLRASIIMLTFQADGAGGADDVQDYAATKFTPGADDWSWDEWHATTDGEVLSNGEVGTRFSSALLWLHALPALPATFLRQVLQRLKTQRAATS